MRSILPNPPSRIRPPPSPLTPCGSTQTDRMNGLGPNALPLRRDLDSPSALQGVFVRPFFSWFAPSSVGRQYPGSGPNTRFSKKHIEDIYELFSKLIVWGGIHSKVTCPVSLCSVSHTDAVGIGLQSSQIDPQGHRTHMTAELSFLGFPVSLSTEGSKPQSWMKRPCGKCMTIILVNSHVVVNLFY